MPLVPLTATSACNALGIPLGRSHPSVQSARFGRENHSSNRYMNRPIAKNVQKIQ